MKSRSEQTLCRLEVGHPFLATGFPFCVCEPGPSQRLPIDKAGWGLLSIDLTKRPATKQATGILLKPLGELHTDAEMNLFE
jgi:hypothetical protein